MKFRKVENEPSSFSKRKFSRNKNQTKRFQCSKGPRGWAAGERVGGGGHAQPADDVGIIVARSCTGCVHGHTGVGRCV